MTGGIPQQNNRFRWLVLEPCFVSFSWLQWGPHTVDRFASFYNAQVGRFNSRFNLEIWFRSRGWFYQLFLKNWETELSPLQAQEEYWSSLIKDTLDWPEIYNLPHCATSDTCKDAWISNWYLVTNAFFVSNWCCASSSVFFVWKRKTNPSNISLLIYCNYAK